MKLKKTIVAIATVTVVGFGGAFLADTVHAETLNDLHNKQSEIKNERSDIKANLSKAESKIADVLLDLEELNSEIKEINDALQANKNALKDTQTDINSTTADIEELQAEIDKLEKAIEKRYEILKKRVVSFQKNGGKVGYMDVIFGSKTFSEFISRVSAVSKITDSDQELMKKQEEDKALVEKQQGKLEGKLAELTDMKTELEGMRSLIADQKQENQKKQKTLKKKQSELVALKDELKVKDSKLASLEAQVKSSIAAKKNPVVVRSNPSDGGNLNTLADKKSSKKGNNSNNNSNNNVASAPPQSGNLSAAINAGYKYLGVPYVWGGKSPSGFDCSGFVSWAFAQAGYSLPSSTAGMQSVGTKISYSQAQPGDLVFFNTYKTNGHVGIYLGGGKFIGSQNSTGLAVANMTSGYWKSKFAGHVRRVR
ncbi:peptidase [Ornithinibacillus gellani]|uniref:C40 family peptidase n=1 Tax=Ornithinibacillus gellani TaxID=2293253 RepID=UPI000F475534|nr:C40 family peptidase [Ornithinibacillus gellani]TQS74744.1 peptidase [Ornithinibacillus gellani]